MLFTFFTRSGKTLDLPPYSKIQHIIKCPILCCDEPKAYTYILKSVSQINPNFTDISKCKYVPTFFLVDTQGNVLNAEMLKTGNVKFYMVFIPDLNNPPRVADNYQDIINTYWKSIKPMFMCYDCNGYYLSVNDNNNPNPNITLFEVRSNENKSTETYPECWICPVTSGLKSSLRYGSNLQIDTNNKFNIYRVKI